MLQNVAFEKVQFKRTHLKNFRLFPIFSSGGKTDVLACCGLQVKFPAQRKNHLPEKRVYSNVKELPTLREIASFLAMTLRGFSKVLLLTCGFQENISTFQIENEKVKIKNVQLSGMRASFVECTKAIDL